MQKSATKVDPSRFEKGQLYIYSYLIPMAVFMGLPIVFIVCHAFKPLGELFAFPPKFFVENPTLDNFSSIVKTTAASDIHISRYVFNSLFVTVIVIILNILISTMGAFALSKFNFKGKKVMLDINNMALMFVSVAVTIPRYLIIKYIGIQNTYLAHILPVLAMPVALFLIKQFMDQIPDTLIEAAYVDGASDLLVYWKIILPLIKPAIATTSILAFQTIWNTVESSTMYIDSESMRTLAFYMNTLANNTNTVAGQGMAAAAALIMFVPNIILFIILQSRVMNTMATSGIK